MRAILEFNLPEDQYEFKVASKGGRYLSTLEDIANHLRSKIKYETLTEAESKVYNDMYDEFYSILSNNDVQIFED